MRLTYALATLVLGTALTACAADTSDSVDDAGVEALDTTDISETESDEVEEQETEQSSPSSSSPWGKPAGTGAVTIETDDGYTAEAQVSWWPAEEIDLANNPDEDCVVDGVSPPSWDTDRAWMRQHIEVTVTNTTQDFDWPDGGYGGVLSDRGMPGILAYCQYGEADQGFKPGTIWLGSQAVDGTTSGMTWFTSSVRSPANPDGTHQDVAGDWEDFHLFFADSRNCDASGKLKVTRDGDICEFFLPL